MLDEPVVWLWFVLIGAFVLARIGEQRLDLTNTKFLRLAGSEELAPSTMRWFYRLSFFILPLVALEFQFVVETLTRASMIVGVLFLSVALVLRFWAIRSLGWLWTLSCWTLPPGAAPVRRGPYRFFAHPDLLSRALDGAGLSLFLGAWHSAILFLVVFSLFAWRIILVENEVLSAARAAFAAGDRAR